MNPYLNVWFKPKMTIEVVLSNEIKFYSHIPIILTALSVSIGAINEESDIIFSILGAAFAYIFLAYLLPGVLLKIGKIWNGKASFEDLENVVGLAFIPMILIFSLQVLSFFVGNIKSHEEVYTGIQFITWLFYIRTLIIGISKAQKFSYVLSILSLVLMILPLILLRLIINPT